MRRLVERMQAVLGAATAVVLFAMMLVTAIDVFGRYVLDKPLPGGFEITEILLAVLIYCGLPLVSARREHIVIDTFDPFFSPAVKRGLDMAAEVICALALGGVGYLIVRRGLRIVEYGDTTNVLRLPLAPVVFLMGATIVIAALVHLSLVFVPHGEDDGKTIV